MKSSGAATNSATAKREPAKEEPNTFTGAAAKAELRKNGQFESLGAALSAARHAIEKIDPNGPHSRGAEYFAANPGQQLRAWFSEDGLELASGIPTPEDEDPWSLKLRLWGIGRGDEITPVLSGTASRSDSRVEIEHHGARITEWFENRRNGLEQGFTLQEPPEGQSGEATVLLQAEGTLRVEEAEGNESIRFVDAAGTEVLQYTGLKAWDASGHTLEARMEVRGKDLLALHVADVRARYPVTIDPLFANVEARLTEEFFAGDLFGSSVALFGNTALVGAPGADTVAGTDAGETYVFLRTGTAWSQQAKLSAGDAGADDHFGSSVALSGDTALVGAPLGDAAAETDAGGAYVFVRASSVWSEQARLSAGDAGAYDHFGSSVALSGDTALVGAPYDDTVAGPRAGSAHVFVRSGFAWSQQAKLTTHDAAAGDTFGSSVALSGDTALVGAPYGNAAAGPDAGAAYVFVRAGSVWGQQVKLAAGDAAADDRFGSSVALSGDTALVGAPHDETAAGPWAGSAHVFVRSGFAWSQQAKLTAGNAAALDTFGSSVALSGDTALVGAPFGDTAAGTEAGSAHVFVRGGAIWAEQDRLIASDGGANDEFGSSVALSGDTALVGAPLDDKAAGPDAGAAYGFVRHEAEWNQQAKLIPPGDTGANDMFGSFVALSGNTALVGAPLDDTAAGTDAGSAYVFARTGGAWAQQAKLTAEDAAANDSFGSSVALSGGTALVGAPHDDTMAGPQAGSAHVFARAGAVWSQHAKLTGDDAAQYDSFGSSVALLGDTALVGAPFGDTAAGADAGGAYVFVRAGPAWIQQVKLTADDAAAEDSFGSSMAISGDTALVGAPHDDTVAGPGAGSAYVFVHTGAVWFQQAKLTAGDAAAYDSFGSSVALSGDTALVGAPRDETAGGLDAGSAYVFARTGAVWDEQAKLTASAPDAFDSFGSSVALSGNTALIGAPLDDTAAGLNAGSAYVFQLIGAVWNPRLVLSSTIDATDLDSFGGSVALSNDVALVGAALDDTTAPDSGSAYTFLLGDLPTFIQNPQSRRIVPGQAVTFSVATSGSSPLRYQWRKDGYEIDGADNMTYVIPSADLIDQGSYDCVVSNVGGVNTSATATLWVLEPSEFPTAIIGPPSEIGPTSAQFNGTVNPRNFDISVLFEYGTDGNTFPYQLVTTPDRVTGNTYVSVHATVAGLNQGQIYYYRIVATDTDIGEVTISGQQSFTTPPAPAAVANTAYGLNSVSARVFGTVNANGWPTDVFIDYGTDDLSFPNSVAATPSVVEGETDIDVSATLTNLLQGTTYHYRVRATSVGGTVLSAVATFDLGTLSGFQQTFPDPAPAADAFLIVDIEPLGIDGAAWRFRGELKWRPGGFPLTGLVPGSREIEFRPVPGYIQPLSRTVLVSADQRPNEMGHYYLAGALGSGELTVHLEPAGLGAKWRLAGLEDDPWNDSGFTKTGLKPGTYLLECKDVSGTVAGREWLIPPPRNVLIADGENKNLTLTYADIVVQTGTAPALVSFDTTPASSDPPYAYVGQIRSSIGSGSGFVVKQRVVATAAHVLYDDQTFSAAIGIQWLFQRDRGDYEPLPLEPMELSDIPGVPRGFYLLDGYSSRRIAENTPGLSSTHSRHLDAAALFFSENAGRGGFSGFLASDSPTNEFLTSSADKILVGYPSTGIPAANVGRMHATPPMNVVFNQVPGEYEAGVPFRVYTTTGIRSSAGGSGGPLCVQHEGGPYYPAAIYLGASGEQGSGHAAVRAIDSDIIGLFDAAEYTANTGQQQVNPGLSLTATETYVTTQEEGALRILLSPPEAILAGAFWRLLDGTETDPNKQWRHSATELDPLNASPGKTLYQLEFKAVPGFEAPPLQTVEVHPEETREYTYHYTELSQELLDWRMLHFGTNENIGNAANDADPDGDGCVNIDEFRAGTDPTLWADCLRILSITRTGTLVTAIVDTKAGRQYALQVSQDPAFGTWTTKATFPPYTADVRVPLIDSTAFSPKAFYRIRVTKP